jgi:hypothetical protein
VLGDLSQNMVAADVLTQIDPSMKQPLLQLGVAVHQGKSASDRFAVFLLARKKRVNFKAYLGNSPSRPVLLAINGKVTCCHVEIRRTVPIGELHGLGGTAPVAAEGFPVENQAETLGP